VTPKPARKQSIPHRGPLGQRAEIASSSRAFPRMKAESVPRAGWVREIRTALGLSQSQLAARAGGSRATVQQMEKAEPAAHHAHKPLPTDSQRRGFWSPSRSCRRRHARGRARRQATLRAGAARRRSRTTRNTAAARGISSVKAQLGGSSCAAAGAGSAPKIPSPKR
jgi:DNA-binding XRE family transcriptional regulator